MLVFKDTSNNIQNDLPECMLYMCQEQILTEIFNATFVSIIADEITDVSNKFELVIL